MPGSANADMFQRMILTATYIYSGELAGTNVNFGSSPNVDVAVIIVPPITTRPSRVGPSGFLLPFPPNTLTDVNL